MMPGDNDLLSILIDDALAGHDPHTVVSLHTAPTDLDPFAEATIRLANPAFGAQSPHLAPGRGAAPRTLAQTCDHAARPRRCGERAARRATRSRFAIVKPMSSAGRVPSWQRYSNVYQRLVKPE
jgi:hypothetical protein